MLKLCGHLLRNQVKPLIAISLKECVNNVQIVSKPTQRILCQRNASTSITGPGAPSMKNEEKVTPLGWFLMVSVHCFKNFREYNFTCSFIGQIFFKSKINVIIFH